MKANINGIFNLMCRDNIKQYELAARTGLAKSTISRTLNHKTNPTVNTIGKLADFFNVSPETLMEV